MYCYFVGAVQTVHPNFTDSEVKEQMRNLIGNAKKRWEKLQPNYVPPKRTKRNSDMQTRQFCAVNNSSASGDRSVAIPMETVQFCAANASSTSVDRSVNISSNCKKSQQMSDLPTQNYTAVHTSYRSNAADDEPIVKRRRSVILRVNDEDDGTTADLEDSDEDLANISGILLSHEPGSPGSPMESVVGSSVGSPDVPHDISPTGSPAKSELGLPDNADDK